MWPKAWRVAGAEFSNLVRTKAFIISIVLMPVLMGGAIGIQVLLEERVDTKVRRFAVLDRSGGFYSTIEQAAAALDRTGVGVIGLVGSSITGTEGNREFLVHGRITERGTHAGSVRRVVSEEHQQ